MTQRTEHLSESKKSEGSKKAEQKRGTKLSRSRVRDAIHGALYIGIAYLFGSCEMLFGTLPLGGALLCASSSHTWYIFAGLILSSFSSPSGFSQWILITVYSVTLLLRLGMLFFVDPPTPSSDGIEYDIEAAAKASKRKTSDKYFIRRDLGYLSHCWRAFCTTLPTRKREKNDTDERADYYPGSMFSQNPPKPYEENDSSKEKASDARLFCENIFLRMLTGCVCGFALGLFAMIRGGFQFYDLFGALFMIISVPLAVFLFAPAFSKEGARVLFIKDSAPHEKDRNPVKYTAFASISASLILFLTVFSAREYYFGFGSFSIGIYLSTVLALMITFLFSNRLGFVPGIIASVGTGLAAAPLLSPIYIISAVSFSLVRPISIRAAVPLGALAGMIWCYFYGGILSLLTLMPSISLTIPVFFVADKISRAFPESDELDDVSISDFAAAVTGKARDEAYRIRLHSLSDAFSEMSEMFYGLSGQLKRPRVSDLEQICRTALERRCDGCKHCQRCKGGDTDLTSLAIRSIVAQLHTDGHADSGKFPDDLHEFCPYIEAVIEEANNSCARLTESLHRSEKTEVYAADYEAVSDMLRGALRYGGEEYKSNKEAADRIYDYLTSVGIGVQGVVVCGKRSCRIIVRGVRFEKSAAKAEEIKTELERICGTKLSDPSFEVDGDRTIMQMHSVAEIRTVFSGSTVAAGDGDAAELYRPLTDDPSSKKSYSPPSPCGDHIALFTSENEYFYALISDGMGSGEEASFTSGICAIFLEKMLSAGGDTEISLRMLNSVIRSKNSGVGEECSATVDLMELDLINGHAVFAKNGAAPTYVVRGGTVYKLRSRSMPLGIMKNSAPQLLRFRMHPGDVIVMVSDGVTHGNDECPWLIDLLSDTLPSSMDSLRLDILKRAIASGSPDDLSAIAIRIDPIQ